MHREMRDTYRRRRDVLVESFARRLGRAAAARLDVRLGADPRAVPQLGSVEFSKLLVEKAEVAVSPGIGFGEHGEGYVRIALVENEQRIRQAARNIRRFLETRRPSSTTSCRSPPAADQDIPMVNL